MRATGLCATHSYTLAFSCGYSFRTLLMKQDMNAFTKYECVTPRMTVILKLSEAVRQSPFLPEPALFIPTLPLAAPIVILCSASAALARAYCFADCFQGCCQGKRGDGTVLGLCSI